MSVRRIAVVLFVLAGLILVPAPALAATTGTAVCVVTDHRVVGLSGLIVTPHGFISISDSNTDKSAIRIWYFDTHCRVVTSISYPTPAYDPEDAALGRDGTLYVADIGDNDKARTSIAVWKLRPGSHTPKIYRYAYPDGPHDAEAILLAGDDTPIFVTKDPLVAGLYTPTAPADPSGHPVPLKRVGSFRLTPTNTSDGVGVLGGFVITGGANSPDRRKVALRSYNDAYEWLVPNGDVVAAITRTAPRITPLPNEPQGESIGYTMDGSAFDTVSDQETRPIHTAILRYPSRVVLPRASSPAVSTRPVAVSVPARSTVLLGVAVAAGLLLIIGGAVGVAVASRRRTARRR